VLLVREDRGTVELVVVGCSACSSAADGGKVNFDCGHRLWSLIRAHFEVNFDLDPCCGMGHECLGLYFDCGDWGDYFAGW